MAQPVKYSRDELVENLQRYGTVLIYRSFRPESDLAQLIRDSVRSNTFRVFPAQLRPPSKIFRDWASSRLTFDLFIKLARVQSQAHYDRLTDDLAMELRDWWYSAGKKPLGVGPGRKLLNLLFKNTIRWSEIEASDRHGLIHLLHVPLDSFTLTAVRQIASTGEFGPVLNIPSKASIGFVTSLELYYRLQELMRKIASWAGVPAICIDLVAWNAAHGMRRIDQVLPAS
jgi:hypothetical protein